MTDCDFTFGPRGASLKFSPGIHRGLVKLAQNNVCYIGPTGITQSLAYVASMYIPACLSSKYVCLFVESHVLYNNVNINQTLTATRRRPTVVCDSCEWAENRDPFKLAGLASSRLASANPVFSCPPF